MGSSGAIELLVNDEFNERCEEVGHSRRFKCLVRFKYGDKVCRRCVNESESTVRVVKHNERNMVSLDEMEQYVDCSFIKVTRSDVRREMIPLKANHLNVVCDANEFCSLSCKTDQVKNEFGDLSSIVKLRFYVKKKRTGGRRKGEYSVFHRFFRLLVNTKRRSGGRRRRVYAVGRNLPPKKRYR